jgi:tetratricopeptide (TPR) repeat protein
MGLVALVAASLGAWAFVASRRSVTSSPSVAAPVPTWNGSPALPEGFVGPEACRDCHGDQYRAWVASTHGQAGGSPSPETVVAPFDGPPIRFADAMVSPESTAEGIYRFRVEREGRPTELYQVDAVIGRGHMLGGGTQGFVSRFTDGTMRFLPFDYSVSDSLWFCNTAGQGGWWTPTAQARVQRLDAGWVPITDGLRLAACGDWPPVRVLGSSTQFANCAQCHGSQITLAFDESTKVYVSDATGYDVNCESCHGPGGRHSELARAGRLGSAEDLAIVSLDVQTEDASLAVCFQCHATKGDLAPGHLPGQPLERHYSLGVPLMTDRSLHADGRVRTFGYQEGHLASACYLDGAMTCVDCHEPHGMGYRDINRRPLSSPFDDGQCLACHASMAAEPTLHTQHEPSTRASLCVSCHMPYLQHPAVGAEVPYARSDHTIAIPRPEFDGRRGIESACAQCHADRSEAELANDLRRLWGPIRPVRPLIAALQDAGADPAPEMLLRPDLEDPVAQILALGTLLEADRRTLRDAVSGTSATTAGESLRALADDDDLDVRSIARALLHWSAGDVGDVQEFLGPRGLAPSSHPETVDERSRWLAALRWTGDHRLERGEVVEAILAYDLALRVWPDHPGALSDLGSAYATIQDVPTALAYYERSLASDPGRSAVHVNRGSLLEQSGRTEAAVEAYLDAIDANPWDALAHANIGNVLFLRQEYARSVDWYRSAVSIDPTRIDTALLLAQSYRLTGYPDSARIHALNVLELDPENDAARRMLLDLGRDL